MTEVYVSAATTVSVALITGVVAVVVALIPYLVQRKRHRRVDATLTAVHEQVANTHETNLRDDLDSVLEKLALLEPPAEQIELIAARLDDISGDIAELRKAQLRESRRFTALDKRLSSHIDGRNQGGTR